MENINKMLNCGDPSFGGAMYVCTTCHNMKFVPFRCKSRFCPTCGVKYSQERSTSMAFKLINCTHRHCVFTIDEELRHFFLEDRSLLNCLFRAVQSVILHMFNKMNKSQNFVPGFICVLHPFGRPLEWNPHIHCTLSEGGFSDNAIWRPVIALKRIDSYDGENVTFHYNRHEDNAYVKYTIPAIEFIKLLIQHIPEKHFKILLK